MIVLVSQSFLYSAQGFLSSNLFLANMFDNEEKATLPWTSSTLYLELEVVATSVRALAFSRLSKIILLPALFFILNM